MIKDNPYLILTSALLLFPLSIAAHSEHEIVKSTPATQEQLGESISIKLIDHELLNERREKVKLVSEVMGDKLVIMNFIYSDCKTVCPISTHILNQVYKDLNANKKYNNNVQLVTLTLNPEIDTPEKMQEFANMYSNSGVRWSWLTGNNIKVNEALLGLRAYAPVVSEHSSVILVGDPKDNHWTGFYQFPKPQNIVNRVNQYIKKREAN